MVGSSSTTVVDVADGVEVVLSSVDERIQVKFRKGRLDVAYRVDTWLRQHAVWVGVHGGVRVRCRVLILLGVRLFVKLKISLNIFTNSFYVKRITSDTRCLYVSQSCETENKR